MKLLSRVETETVLLLSENNFIVTNAALDMGCSSAVVTKRLKKIREECSDLFTYRPLPENAVRGSRINGFTEKGHLFYWYAKHFVKCLDEL